MNFVWILTLVAGGLFLLGTLEYLGRLVNRFGKLDTFDNMEFYIRYYCEKGYNKTILRLRDTQSGQSLDFVKLIPLGNGPTRYLFQLRSEATTPELFDRALSALDEADTDYYVTSQYDPAPPRIIVECGRDTAKAVFLAELVLGRLYGLSGASPIRVGCIGPLNSNRKKIIGW